MRFRDVYLAKAETVPDSGTKIIDIDVSDPIQYILIKYSATNGSTSNTVGKINPDIDKIEVVDGADTIFSITGRLAQALAFFLTGKLPVQELNQDGGDTVTEWFLIPFGRNLVDRDLFLDPKKFTNLQLKLTHSLTISATAGFASGSGSVSVIARVIEAGAPAPQGFIMTKEIFSFTTAASGDQIVDLPLDYPYLSLMVSDLETGIVCGTDINNIKLSLDFDKVIPFDISAADLIALNVQRYGFAIQDIEILPDTTFSVNCDTYKYTRAFAGEPGATAKMAITTVTAEQIAGTMTTGETGDIHITTMGACPHSCMFIPFGDGKDLEDFLDVKEFKSARLVLTQGGAGGAGKVVIQQLRK